MDQENQNIKEKKGKLIYGSGLLVSRGGEGGENEKKVKFDCEK